MMCENCLYNKNCQFLLKHKNDEVEGCTAFEDKSEWVRLPTKDVKSAYFSIGYGDEAKMVEEDVRGFGIKDGKLCVVDNFGDFYEIGKIAFLTKKEAEKAVERRRKLL